MCSLHCHSFIYQISSAYLLDVKNRFSTEPVTVDKIGKNPGPSGAYI